jgi:translation initiation factor IF-1
MSYNKGVKSSRSFGKGKSKQKKHSNYKKDIIYAEPEDGTFYGYITQKLGNRRFLARVLSENGETVIVNCSTTGSMTKHRVYVNDSDIVLVNNVVGDTYQIVQKYNHQQIDQLESENKLDIGIINGESDGIIKRKIKFKKEIQLAEPSKNIHYARIKNIISSVFVIVEGLIDSQIKELRCDIHSKVKRTNVIINTGDYVLINKLAKEHYQVIHWFDTDEVKELIGNSHLDISLFGENSKFTNCDEKPTKETHKELLDDAFNDIFDALN